MDTNNEDIVSDVPEHIWQQCKAYRECPNGWQKIAKNVEGVLLAEGVKIHQMKEKFGSLRVYWDWPEEWNGLEDGTFHDKCEQIDCLIDIADWVCQKTCMECGEEGEIYTDRGWVRVLCQIHRFEEGMIEEVENERIYFVRN